MAALIKINEQLRQLAMRLAEQSTVPITIKELETHPDASRLKAQVWHAATALNGLSKEGHLIRTRVGRNYLYEFPRKKGEPVIQSHDVPKEKNDEPQAATLQVQVNKATKTLRLTYEGLQIEISVV